MPPVFPPASLSIACIAILVEGICGYPARLFRLIGHPVTWIGAMIGWLDRTLNRDSASFAARRACGVVALGLVIGVWVSGAAIISTIAHASGPGWVALVLCGGLAASLPAQRALWSHVRAVRDALETGGLKAGQDAVSHIVGRNPAMLDLPGVVRAAIESLAENFSDGIVAPIVWTALAGLPGGVAYKAVNTADSMIGHRTARHTAFGWAAARIDDVVNLPASRLSALWITLAALAMPGTSARGAVRAVLRDARHHRSPNAGWPEAAMAGALGLRLAGPRVYGDTMIDDAWMGDGRAAATAQDLTRALALYRRACLIQAAALLVLTTALCP